MRPLYRVAGGPRNRPGAGHAGLWYDKFCDKWQEDGQSWSMKGGADSGGNPKLEWIRTVEGRVGSDVIEEHALRVVKLVRDRDGIHDVFRSGSRFVSGLGRSHPVENGFAWHHTLGVPYLPGSSVKGMVRAWAEAEGEGTGRPVARLLGDRKSGAAGTLAFMDAVPVERVQLEADVMTPHYANWTPDDPPGDWRSPTPIPFLTMAAGTRMLFGVIPCRGATADDTSIVMDWIADALEWQGAGAKTAVGYGRFERDEEATKALEHRLETARQLQVEKRRRAAMSPVEREIQDIIANRPDKQSLPSTAVYQTISSGRWKDADRRQAIEWLKAEMEKDDTWRPKSSRPTKDKAHQRTRRVIDWLSHE